MGLASKKVVIRFALKTIKTDGRKNAATKTGDTTNAAGSAAEGGVKFTANVAISLPLKGIELWEYKS